MSTLRERISDHSESLYQASDFATVVSNLNVKRYNIVNTVPGGWDAAAAVLTHYERSAVLRVMELAARDLENNPQAAVIAHGLRKFSAATIDFSKSETQELFDSLPTLAAVYAPSLTDVVTAEVTAKLKSVGIRSESDADQLNGGTDYVIADIQAVWDAEQAAALRGSLLEYAATRMSVVNEGIMNGTIRSEGEAVAAFQG